MIYLDYSATTPVNKGVLETFNKVSTDFVGNANSLHKLGVDANKLIISATNQIKNILNIEDYEIIYTSGSTEANNLAIKGLCLKYQNRGKHIITTHLEHSSVYGPIENLKKLGFIVSYIETDESGVIKTDDLKKLMRDDTILVSINAVNSELGISQNINELGKYIKNNSKSFFHVDLTQAIGKINVSLENIDLCSFSAHKIYGLKGIGALIKRNNIELENIIHGGKSSSIYRSGTPNHPLIASFSKALRLASESILDRYNYVQELNDIIRNKLSEYDDVFINSKDNSIPHILNISIIGIKAETFLHALEEVNIYISTKSACSDDDSYSDVVYKLTNDLERAKSSIRISLSYLTTKEEIREFLDCFDKCYKKLISLR